MKTLKINLFCTLAFFLIGMTAYGQTPAALDTIFKVNNDIIECRITELNTTEVKYFYVDRPTIILAIESELVDYVRLSTGEILHPSNNDAEIANMAYDKQHRMVIKLGFLTPLQGYTELGLEYSKEPLQSIDATIGIIGLGTDQLDLGQGKGVSLTTGYKFYAGPDFYLRKVRNAHRMNGMYMKPTIALSYHIDENEVWAYDPNTFQNETVNVKTEVFKAALLLQVGRQYVFNDIVCLDLNVGLGYGTKNVNRIDWPESVTGYDYIDIGRGYGLSIFGEGGLAFTSTIKFGVLLK